MHQGSLNFIKSYENKDFVITESNIKFKKFVFTISGSDNQIAFSPGNDSIENVHFSGILNLKYKSINDLPEFMEFVTQLNIYNYCPVCHNALESQSEQLIPCSNDQCRFKFEELILGNPVIEYLEHNPEIFEFLMESAKDAISCQRHMDIFEPFPTYFLMEKTKVMTRGKLSKLSGENYDHLKDFKKLTDILNKLDIPELINKKCKSDSQLAKSIGTETYILIRFILLSLKVRIEKNDESLNITNQEFKNVKIYKIIHPQDKYEDFNKTKQPITFLFHGSRWHNWYSILRNGLKNCSGTQLMTAGAAYGNGIYLSDNLNISYGYGMSGHKSAVGVFEVMNAQSFNRAPGYFVVDQENSLIQKYLLIFSNKFHDFQQINDLFAKTIHREQGILNTKLTQKCVTKIMREYKLISKLNPEQSRFRVEMNPDSISLWKIFIMKFDKESTIFSDMQKFNIKEIELEIRFPENYPFVPPFVRIVAPRFVHLTAHITTGGSICYELLTPKGWSPGFIIESIIVQIMAFIVEGNGRIDPDKYSIPYALSEAQDSFKRVASSHGWL